MTAGRNPLSLQNEIIVSVLAINTASRQRLFFKKQCPELSQDFNGDMEIGTVWKKSIHASRKEHKLCCNIFFNVNLS